jgi:hypothetical protein
MHENCNLGLITNESIGSGKMAWELDTTATRKPWEASIPNNVVVHEAGFPS